MSIMRQLCSKKFFQKSSKLLARNSSNFVIKSDLPSIELPDCSLDEFLLQKTSAWPNHIATECVVTGRKFTHAEVKEKSIYLNRHLRKKLKLQKRDVIAVLLPNSPEFILIVLAAARAGIVVTTLNPIYTPGEISRQLSDCSAKAIITLNELHPLAKASANLTTKKDLPILTIKTQAGQSLSEGALNFEEFVEAVDFPDLPPANPADLAIIPYSSGTSGLPKGVEITHRNLTSMLALLRCDKLGILEDTTDNQQNTIAGVIPQFHIYGLVITVLHTYQRGCKTACIPKFSPELYLSTIENHRSDVLFLAPPLVLFLSGHPSVTPDKLKSVKRIVSGAAPLGKLDETRLFEKLQKDCRFSQGYGMTETTGVVSITRPDMKNIDTSGSIGRQLGQTEIKIVDEDDPTHTPLGPNKVGELFVKGPQVTQAYYNNPEETRNMITKDGWLKTGDLVLYNENNIMYVKDRLKDLIKVKGLQVAPAELEEIIRDFPDVADAGVVGVPHPTQGEVPKAFIVAKPGKSLDKRKIEEFVASKVAPYKKLAGGIDVVDSLPKNTTGKILRKILRDNLNKTS